MTWQHEEEEIGTPPTSSSLLKVLQRRAAQQPSFILFCKLPVELQIQIWEQILHSNTNILHTRHTRLYKHQAHDDSTPCVVHWTRCVLAMRVCCLSRRIAWEFYLALPTPYCTYAEWSRYRCPGIPGQLCSLKFEGPQVEKTVASGLVTKGRDEVGAEQYLILHSGHQWEWYLNNRTRVCTLPEADPYVDQYEGIRDLQWNLKRLRKSANTAN